MGVQQRRINWSTRTAGTKSKKSESYQLCFVPAGCGLPSSTQHLQTLSPTTPFPLPHPAILRRCGWGARLGTSPLVCWLSSNLYVAIKLFARPPIRCPVACGLGLVVRGRFLGLVLSTKFMDVLSEVFQNPKP